MSICVNLMYTADVCDGWCVILGTNRLWTLPTIKYKKPEFYNLV